MTVLKSPGRSDLATDSVDRRPRTLDHGVHLKREFKDKRIEHQQYVDRHGGDLPEVRDWKGKI
jgi:xylulose-5-phosphate/fructose-6-phosphate phosphoketolase